MGKSKSQDQASHGGGKRNAERLSSDANELRREGSDRSLPEVDEHGPAERDDSTGASADPDALGDTDLDRRTAAARRDPAEGPRRKSQDHG